jgi:hypothetical protein
MNAQQALAATQLHFETLGYSTKLESKPIQKNKMRSPAEIAAQIASILPQDLSLELKQGFMKIAKELGPFAAPELSLPPLMSFLTRLSSSMDAETYARAVQICNRPNEGVPEVDVNEFLRV